MGCVDSKQATQTDEVTVTTAGAPKRTKNPKVLIIIHSTWGHIYQLGRVFEKTIKEELKGIADLKRVPDLVGDRPSPVADYNALPVVTSKELADYDCLIFGVPTRFGVMSAQMKSFIDSLGQLWMGDQLVGKIGTIFTSTGGQHGGNELTIISATVPLYHLGLVLVGLPSTFKGFNGDVDTVNGGTPYGVSTIAGADGKRQPSKPELDSAAFQAKHVYELSSRLIN